MSKKAKILVTTYTLALILSLGLCLWVSQYSLRGHARAADYSAARAFEETIVSVSRLHAALQKTPYAFDSGMKGRLCSEIYASAQAAEAAMSTLPFSTQELEQLSAFLNQAGDFAYTQVCRMEGERFGEDELPSFQSLALRAEEFVALLQDLLGQLNSDELQMDSRQRPVYNVTDEEERYLSQELLAYEEGLEALALPSYGGQYSREEEKERRGSLNESQMKELAAAYAGVQPGQLQVEYAYAGEQRRCYRAGELLICVSPAGVESMGQSRLVSESRMTLEQAEQLASDFLKKQGFEDLQLVEARENGAIALMKYAAQRDGALCLNCSLDIAIAMDDGSVYSLNALDYDEEAEPASWKLSLEQAAEKLPPDLTVLDSRKLILEDASGKALSAYEFFCRDEQGEKLSLSLDGNSGAQIEIFFRPKA